MSDMDLPVSPVGISNAQRRLHVSPLPCLAIASTLVISCLSGGCGGSEQSNPRRGEVKGRVLQFDGKAWKGARVTLLSRPYPHVPDIGPADIIRCVADSEGKFSARILEERVYSCWASSSSGSLYRVSAVVEQVMCGVSVKLIQARVPRCHSILVINGLAAWKHRAPFRVRIMANGVEQRYEIAEPVVGGRLELPEMPGGETCDVTLIDSKGIPVFQFSYVSLVQKGGDKLAEHTNTSLDQVEKRVIMRHIPAPGSVSIRVIGPRGLGAKAAILAKQDRYGRWIEVGRTDETGSASIEMAMAGSFGTPATWPGAGLLVRGTGISDLYWNPISGRDLNASPPKPKLKLAAESGYRLTGQLAFGGKPPNRPIPLILYSSVRIDRNQRTVGDVFLHWTEKSGRFRIEGRHSQLGHRLCAILARSDLAHTSVQEDRAIWPEVLLDATAATGKQDHDLGTIDVADLHLMEVEVKKPDGSRADRPVIYLSELDTVNAFALEPIRIRATRHGRARLLLRRGLRVGIVVATADGYWLEEIRVPEQRTSLVSANLTRRVIRGRVVNSRSNAPITGARVSWLSYGPEPFDAMLEACRVRGAFAASAGPTNKEGAFRLFVPSTAETYFVTATTQSPDGIKRSKPVVVRPGTDESEPITLRIGNRP